MTIRGFSSQNGEPLVRSLEDAPPAFRVELVDLLFLAGESAQLSESFVYERIGQSLGVAVPGSPIGPRRAKAVQVVSAAAWPRVFDLILRFVPEFTRRGCFDVYREAVNKLLAAYGLAWDLGMDGHFTRLLPSPALALVAAAMAELSAPNFQPAATLFCSAQDAYNDRPRRDRDACANMFDSLESVAKARFGDPHDTFGATVTKMRAANAANPQVISVLEAINTLRNRNFGHGLTVPFPLTSGEVDFSYLACVAGILLVTRIP